MIISLLITYTDRMHYIIPNLPAWVLREAPDTPPEQQVAQRKLDVAEAQAALRILVGDNTPLIEAVGRYGVDVLKFVKGEQNMRDVFGISEEDAHKLESLVLLADILHIKKRGSLWFIRNISDVQQACSPLASLQREELHILLVNEHYQLIHQEIIAAGSVDLLAVQPADVLQPAVERRVPAFVLVHNHPTGDPTPSADDLVFTTKIQEAAGVLGKTMLDHVIVAAGGVTSCLDSLAREQEQNR
jgi:DNA repair protein RadC